MAGPRWLGVLRRRERFEGSPGLADGGQDVEEIAVLRARRSSLVPITLSPAASALSSLPSWGRFRSSIRAYTTLTIYKVTADKYGLVAAIQFIAGAAGASVDAAAHAAILTISAIPTCWPTCSCWQLAAPRQECRPRLLYAQTRPRHLQGQYRRDPGAVVGAYSACGRQESHPRGQVGEGA